MTWWKQELSRTISSHWNWRVMEKRAIVRNRSYLEPAMFILNDVGVVQTFTNFYFSQHLRRRKYRNLRPGMISNLLKPSFIITYRNFLHGIFTLMGCCDSNSTWMKTDYQTQRFLIRLIFQFFILFDWLDKRRPKSDGRGKPDRSCRFLRENQKCVKWRICLSHCIMDAIPQQQKCNKKSV